MKQRIETMIAKGYSCTTISNLLDKEGIDLSPGQVWRIYIGHETI